MKKSIILITLLSIHLLASPQQEQFNKLLYEGLGEFPMFWKTYVNTYAILYGQPSLITAASDLNSGNIVDVTWEHVDTIPGHEYVFKNTLSVTLAPLPMIVEYTILNVDYRTDDFNQILKYLEINKKDWDKEYKQSELKYSSDKSIIFETYQKQNKTIHYKFARIVVGGKYINIQRYYSPVVDYILKNANK